VAASGVASVVPAPNLRAPRTRSQSGVFRPLQRTDGTVRYGGFASTGGPENLGEALQNVDWKNAMDSEYSAFMNNKTWHLVPPSQGGISLIVNGSIK
jgi:hypothetical protein